MERLDLGPEDIALALISPIQRFDAEPVSYKGQVPAFAIKDRKGKHADRRLDGFFHTPFCDRREQYDGVGSRVYVVAFGAELPRDVAKVVDLAIEDQNIARACRCGGLPPLGRGGDHGKPAMAEPDSGVCVDPGAIIIRPPMPQTVSHGFGVVLQIVDGQGAAQIIDSGDAAHGS